MYIASQILVVLADSLYVVSMFTKNKKWLLFWFVISDIFFGVHLFLLNAFTGGYTLLADVIFLFIAYILNEKGKEKYTFIPSIIFVCITLAITILTWNGAISLLPMFGMSIYFVGMGMGKLYFNKIGSGTRNLCNIVYMFLISSYFGACLEILLFASAVAGSILSIKKDKSEKEITNEK